jgi:hypothetical protein
MPATVAADEVAPWIERLARVGWIAKGVLYVTIGALAVSAALGQGAGKGTDNHGAMATLYGAPLGRPLLAVLALGIAGYAVWRIIEGIHDPEHRGTSPKGIALRATYVGSGLVHLALAATAGGLAFLRDGGKGEDEHAKHLSARALEIPGGAAALWITAAILIGYGVYELYCAWTAKLDDELDLHGMRSATRRIVIGVSRFGIAARAIVFGTIGVLFVRAATNHDPRASGGIGDSLKQLGQLGRWPFFAIATGVVGYGLYQFICARYRRIVIR